MDRRTVLVGAATLAGFPALAGCSGSDRSEGGQGSEPNGRIDREGAGPMAAEPISVHPRNLLLTPRRLPTQWIPPNPDRPIQEQIRTSVDGDIQRYELAEGEKATSASLLIQSFPLRAVQISSTTTVFEDAERSVRAYDYSYGNSQLAAAAGRVGRYWEDEYGDESYHYTMHTDEYLVGVSEIRVANAIGSLQVYMQFMDETELDNQLPNYNSRFTDVLTAAP